MRRIQWLWRGLCFVGGIAFALLCQSLTKRVPPPEASPRVIPTANAGPARPWGTLEALEIPLADKEEFAPDRQLRLQPPQWFFEGWDEKQLVAFIQGCDLTEDQKLDLCRSTPWQVASNGLVGSPSLRLVQGLRASAREQIYDALARSPANYAQRYPFRFPANEFESRLTSSGLAEAKLKMITSLAYSDGADSCFTDLELLPSLLSSEELDTVLDCLYRLPVYRLRLRIFHDSDVDALAKYWGKGGRESRIKPLLESLTKVRKQGGTTVGIGYLLPPFARLRLNTFPRGWTEPQTNKEDCFWTSLNFLNDQPDMRYLDPAFVRKTLQTDFVQVNGAPTFGDLITLRDASGAAVHMCVYIADDFVFTKNGMNPLAPWVLMRIQDMLSFFPSSQRRARVILRRKAGASGPQPG
jgi:hypothetical protein